MPTTVHTPATTPTEIARKWYTPSVMPTASVQDLGMPRPMTWPRKTARIPKWNIGLAQRSRRLS